MGTGKTAAGKEVSGRLKRKFLDLDELIELREKRGIPDIFSHSGEAYFRRLEKKVLREISNENDFVVACGGGIVIDPENIKVMKESGKIICLTSSPKVILRRTSGCAHRPLLNVDDPEKQIEHLLKLRAPFYAKADITIDASDLSVTQTADKIISEIFGKDK